ncbi:MAG: hypothetical protein FWC47_01310 [Oscillospiraceae bacterium]|nr:hypothetical protein [Oscillospiraceae bacterium]
MRRGGPHWRGGPRGLRRDFRGYPYGGGGFFRGRHHGGYYRRSGCLPGCFGCMTFIVIIVVVITLAIILIF